MRRLIVILPVAIFAALIGVMASLLTDSERNSDLSRLPSALIGQPVPAFELPAVTRGLPGGFSSADLRGRVTVLSVFASWCVPCLAEHPQITQIAETGTPIYGLNHRDKPEDAENWLRRHGNPYTAVGADLNGRASVEWGVTGVPETFIIDASGRIAYKHVGPVTPDALNEKIMPLLRRTRGG